MDEKLAMSRQCPLTAQKTSRTMGCIKIGQQVEGGDSAPLLCSHETPPAVLRAVLGSPVQARHGPVGVGPEEGHENSQRAETHLL